jgi:cytochrome c biogenesis protein CcdA/thiol-disulfide isomerase/thioredoxin
MDVVVINGALAFFEGFALILSPCIWPILPIILSGSLEGNKSKPFGIILGFILTFIIVTLFSRALILYLHINPNTLRNISYVILVSMGLIMLSTSLTERFNIWTSGLSKVGNSVNAVNNPRSGFSGGVLFGSLVGIIWTPCAGPILATVIVQTVIQHTTLSSVLVVAAFAIGAGVPMLLIALTGRRLMEKFGFLHRDSRLLRKALGCILIASVLFLIYTPHFQFAISSNQPQGSATSLVNGVGQPYPAPQVANIDAWINSPPLKISDLKGRVVLIDFWTYSCINCIRTLPYLKNWYAKYHHNGFDIIGIHSPEFEFEHDLSNVKNAIKEEEILYPVALDNHFSTWQNFRNQYWPAHYLINQNGEVVYEHFGEGDYDITENNIRYLLGLAPTKAVESKNTNYFQTLTPETYLGYRRMDHFSNPESIVRDGLGIYHYPDKLLTDQWALQGEWHIDSDKIIAAGEGASIKLRFNAKNVYAVMGATGNLIKIRLFVSGKSTVNKMPVSRNQLYSIVDLDQQAEGEIELTAMKPGLEIYTFTFGN